eukprot:384984-Prorocentrum_minimum.AAC.2
MTAGSPSCDQSHEGREHIPGDGTNHTRKGSIYPAPEPITCGKGAYTRGPATLPRPGADRSPPPTREQPSTKNAQTRFTIVNSPDLIVNSPDLIVNSPVHSFLAACSQARRASGLADSAVRWGLVRTS